MIPQGRITPITLQKRAEELAKLFGEFSVMVGRVQPAETLIGSRETASYQGRQEYLSNSFRSRQERPTEPLHVVTQRPSDLDVVREDIKTCANKIADAEEAIEDIQGQLAGVRKRAADLEGLTGESDAAQQLQAVSRGMANAVRRIRALEEENRLLREAQLATVQDVLALQESVRRLEHHDGSQQEHG